MVVKTDLESMLDESAFGAATEMGEFALDKGPEVSLAREHFWTSIFASSASVGGSAKRSVSTTLAPTGSLNKKRPTPMLPPLQSLQIQFSASLNTCFLPF